MTSFLIRHKTLFFQIEKTFSWYNKSMPYVRKARKVRMPARAKPSYARKAKAPRRARASLGRVSVNIRGTNGSFLPQRATSVHKYTEVVSVATVAGIMNDHLINLNSMFDPNRTGAGHQPQGRDTMALLYNRYRVDGVKARVTISKVTDLIVGWHGIAANNDSTAFVNPLSAVCEQPYISDNQNTASLGTSRTTLTFNRYFKLAQLTGVSPQVYRSDDRFQAQIGSSPSELLILHILGCDLQETANYNYIIKYDLEFHCTWFDPLVVAQS